VAFLPEIHVRVLETSPTDLRRIYWEVINPVTGCGADAVSRHQLRSVSHLLRESVGTQRTDRRKPAGHKTKVALVSAGRGRSPEGPAWTDQDAGLCLWIESDSKMAGMAPHRGLSKHFEATERDVLVSGGFGHSMAHRLVRGHQPGRNL
jgi:hypothetical protein